MTDDDSGVLNRRSVLAGIGAAGAGAALGGFGTSALFTDDETLDDNEIVAGELNLFVDWREKYDKGDGMKLIDVFPAKEKGAKEQDDLEIEEFCDTFGDIDDPLNDKRRSIIDYDDRDDVTTGNENGQPLVHLNDVKPGDCWKTILSYHLCGNDGWVWFRTKNKAFLDDDGDHKDEEHLADKAWARVWYDMYDGGDAEPGDGKYDPENEPVIAEGSLRDVLKELNDGVLLDADPELVDANATNGENDYDVKTQSDFERSIEWGGQGSENAELDCEEDEVGFWKWVLTSGGPTPVEDGAVLTVEFEDGTSETATGFRPGQGRGAVQFEVFKDGGGTVDSATVEFNGGDEDRAVLTISESECLDDEDENGDEPVNGDPKCTMESDTHYIGFEWCLPRDTGNVIERDRLEFDFEFFTEQCRHNDDPQNPFEDDS